MTRLYGSPLSWNARRVQVTALELGLDPDVVLVDVTKGEQRADDFLALNPNGKVPVLVDDEFALWESNAIAWYLAEQNPSKGLLPLDIKSRADQMRWMFWNASHVEPALAGLVHERVIKPKLLETETDGARCAVHVAELDRFLPVLNGHLEGRPWLGARGCSLADVCLGVTLALAPAAQFDLGPSKHIAAWMARLEARPSWKRVPLPTI